MYNSCCGNININPNLHCGESKVLSLLSKNGKKILLPLFI